MGDGGGLAWESPGGWTAAGQPGAHPVLDPADDGGYGSVA
jgi:hypothetical protein